MTDFRLLPLVCTHTHLLALEAHPVLLHGDVEAADYQWTGDPQVPPVFVHEVKQQQPVDLHQIPFRQRSSGEWVIRKIAVCVLRRCRT